MDFLMFNPVSEGDLDPPPPNSSPSQEGANPGTGGGVRLSGLREAALSTTVSAEELRRVCGRRRLGLFGAAAREKSREEGGDSDLLYIYFLK